MPDLVLYNKQNREVRRITVNTECANNKNVTEETQVIYDNKVYTFSHESEKAYYNGNIKVFVYKEHPNFIHIK